MASTPINKERIHALKKKRAVKTINQKNAARKENYSVPV
jgi:hypothetical protein